MIFRGYEGKHANPYLAFERSVAQHEHEAEAACPNCHPTVYAELYARHVR
jgi:hypothetical protein